MLALLVSFLSACDAVLTPPPTATPTLISIADGVELTTATIASGSFITPIPPTPTFTPSPTPTPVIHSVSQGDTLFGVAMEYGVSVDALLYVNGITTEDYLSIGQALIIPMEEEEEFEMAAAVPVGNMILPTPTPLPLAVDGVALYRTPIGGLWCMGEVINTTDSPITNLQVQVVLVSQQGLPLDNGIALAAADHLLPEGRAPFALLFKEPPEGVEDAQVSLLRGESVSAITASFMPLSVTDSGGAVSGPQYRVHGHVLNESSYSVARISIVVTLYDEARQVIGYRQENWVVDAALLSQQQEEFELLLTPQGLDIPASFSVIAWGVLNTG